MGVYHQGEGEEGNHTTTIRTMRQLKLSHNEVAIIERALEISRRAFEKAREPLAITSLEELKHFRDMEIQLEDLAYEIKNGLKDC